MPDVQKGNVCQGEVFVGSMKKVDDTERVIMYVQMEHQKKSKLQFDGVRDKKAFEVISRIVSSILERLVVKSRTSLTQARAYKILNTFSVFMGKKQHLSFCQEFEAKFPSLFNFENCALMFIDPATQGMYKFHASV